MCDRCPNTNPCQGTQYYLNADTYSPVFLRTIDKLKNCLAYDKQVLVNFCFHTWLRFGALR